MTKPRIAAIVAAAALGAAAFTGATMALAADGQPTPSPSAVDSAQRTERHGPGDRGPGQHGPGDRGPGQHGPSAGGPGGPLLHSEGVVEDADGNFITIRMQQGAVTAVSTTSITVKSADDYSATYAITEDTVVERDGEGGVPKMGDVVHVRATVTGGSATAEVIHALSPEKAQELKDHRAAMQDWMADRPERPSGPGRA